MATFFIWRRRPEPETICYHSMILFLVLFHHTAQGYRVMSATAILTLLTQGQKYILNSGNQIDLDCEFFMEHFTMFDNPIVWKKSQLEEVTHVNTMRNIHPPFLLTNRFEVRFTNAPPRYRLQLIIKNCTAEDSGNYTCEIRGRRSTVLDSVTHSVSVRAPVHRVFFTADNLTSDLIVNPAEDRLRQVTFIEGQGRSLRCVSLGGYPPPSLHIYLGDDDVTDEFTPSGSVSLHGVRGLRLMIYRTDRCTDQLTASTGNDGGHIRCVASVPGLGSNVTTAKISVNYGPVISCQSASAIVGDREVRIQCEIRSRPDLSALFWIIDVNGTTVTEERGFHDFWSLVRVISDGVVETQLCLKQVLPHHFRKYTVVAENNVAITTDEVELRRNHPSSQHKNKPDIITKAPEISRRLVHHPQNPRKDPPYVFIPSSMTSSASNPRCWMAAMLTCAVFTSLDSLSTSRFSLVAMFGYVMFTSLDPTSSFSCDWQAPNLFNL